MNSNPGCWRIEGMTREASILIPNVRPDDSPWQARKLMREFSGNSLVDGNDHVADADINSMRRSDCEETIRQKALWKRWTFAQYTLGYTRALRFQNPPIPCTIELDFNRLRVGLDPLLTLLDVGLKVLQAHIEETLLVLGDLADRVDLLNTVGSESDVR